MGIGALLIVPAWCAFGEDSIYSAGASVTVPQWLLAVVGAGIFGIGSFLQVLPAERHEKRERREASEAAERERLEQVKARTRVLWQNPRYRELRKRRDELREADFSTYDTGTPQEKAAIHEEQEAVGRELEAIQDEVDRSFGGRGDQDLAP